MKKKNKKILVILLIVCLAFSLVGCGFDQANYDPDPDSFTGHLIGGILNFFQGLTSKIGLPNYCVAIFILTLLVKLATHPLTVKQQRNVKNMNSVQPKMKAIDKKYADNPQKKQEAMMKLYKEENINPMTSCLPLLIQMPILMILFWGMRNFIPPADLTQYYSFFWIENLSVSVSITAYPFTLPLLCALTTVLQQFVSMPNMRDRTQRMMLIIMPVMFYFISLQFPAGLCLYWIFYGLLSALQTLYVNYRLKIGIFASPEEKQQRKLDIAAAKEEKAEKAGGKQGNKNEVEKGQQSHPHTHQEDSKKNLPDKPWQ